MNNLNFEKENKKNKIYVGSYITLNTYNSIVKLAEERELALSDIIRLALRELILKEAKEN